MELKSNYEEEEIHIGFYIMIIIMAILFLICGGIGINQLINEKCDIGIIIIFGLLFFGIPISFIYFCYRNIHRAKIKREEAKKIIENGIKVQGKIIDVRTEKVYERNRTVDGGETTTLRYHYHLIVEYSNDGNIYTIESPSVNFHPDYLISKSVDVYLYENSFYIDNFQLDFETMEINRKKRIRKNIIALLLFILLLIVNGVIIFLSINKIIPSELGFKLCMLSLAISAMLAISITLYKGIKSMVQAIKEVYKNK